MPSPKGKPQRLEGARKPSAAEKLTVKHARFIEEYLMSGNGAEAARKAGYSVHTAKARAHELLHTPAIAEAIKARQAKLAAKYEVTQERIIEELAKLGFSNMLDYLPFARSGEIDDLDRDKAAALTEVTVDSVGEEATRVRFKLADKRAALVDLGKITGLFKDGAEVAIPVSFVVERTGRSK